MKKANEIDQFRVHQQAFYVRGDVIVDVHQARGIRPASAGDRCILCLAPHVYVPERDDVVCCPFFYMFVDRRMS